ncbi:hypothetical protein BN1723_019689 [Verticillium longisporum]|uniref:Uncharacterized protein n=1 Tax=Verticillium longisporum TaxID=100787 RepID=A0A0G4NFP2_VERLO|nr:hypothetical protein BN1723_019689 [Verticillium longisporum]
MAATVLRSASTSQGNPKRKEGKGPMQRDVPRKRRTRKCGPSHPPWSSRSRITQRNSCRSPTRITAFSSTRR